MDISARRFPNKDALIFLGTRLSYADLRSQAERLAAYLQSVGVQKGDRVILNMQNCPQLVIAPTAAPANSKTLPDTGFADDIGLPTLLMSVAGLLGVIVITRSIRRFAN